MSVAGVFGLIITAAALGGASAGLAGCFTVALRMPFLAVCMAHAAMAGAVFAELAGLPLQAGALIGALTGALILLVLLREPYAAPGAAVGFVFSLMLGLAFLGIGLSEGPRTGALGLMWGSLLFVTPIQTAAMAAVLLVAVGITWAGYGEIKAVMFSRALAGGLVPERRLFALLLLLCALVITVNLQAVGGLLLYSLICNPAMAAARWARGVRAFLLIGALVGALAAVLGFVAAWFLDLPTGACIVIVSSLPVGLSRLPCGAKVGTRNTR